MRSKHLHPGGGLNPLHGILLSFPIALFASALASDIAYLNTAEIQWTNFSAWLIAGALVFGGFVALWSLIALFRGAGRGKRLIYFVVVAAMWLLGLLNAFKHSQDAWSSVGTLGLGLSIACTVLALIAGLLAFSGFGSREVAR